MLNICTKTLWRCQSLKQTFRILAAQNYASFSVKDILYETSDEAGTLITRFAKHVAQERQKICEQVPSDVKYSDYFPVSDMRYFEKELRNTPKEQLAAVIIYAFTYRSNADPNKFAIILNLLDSHALHNVDDMSADTILRTLYSFLFLIPNWMTRLDFYGRAMQRLYEEFEKDCWSPYQQIQGTVCSIVFLHGSNDYMKEMSTVDMALVSNAAYKTSNVIKSDEFNQRLLKEVLDISNTSNGNDALLVSFIKSMRLQRLHSPIVCEYIANICQDTQKLQQLQARGQVHLFAYLAENLWDSKECTQPLIEAITEQITLSRRRTAGHSATIRGKDIATFLWSCAQLNCSLSSIQFRTIENSLLDKLNTKEFNYFTDQLVECCLCLWTLGYKTKELLQAAVQLKSESTIKRQQPKVESRFTVLLSAAQIEEPDWCATVIKGFEAFNLKAKVHSYLFNNQDIPYQEIISQLLKEEFVASANISCPINGINIPGIHVKLAAPSHNQVFLEFMTPTQTLHFSKEPVAILRLKLRLLESLGHKVKLLSLSSALDSESLKNALIECSESDADIREPSKSSIKA
ncbi:hypothetical protein CVS40_9180 [Lucilia cuprina]|nr:hypothetical protein CVS40_9180 [Lucilia cuprina]